MMSWKTPQRTAVFGEASSSSWVGDLTSTVGDYGLGSFNQV